MSLDEIACADRLATLEARIPNLQGGVSADVLWGWDTAGSSDRQKSSLLSRQLVVMSSSRLVRNTQRNRLSTPEITVHFKVCRLDERQ